MRLKAFYLLFITVFIAGCSKNPNTQMDKYIPPIVESPNDSRGMSELDPEIGNSSPKDFTSATGENCWILELQNNLTSLCKDGGKIKESKNILSNEL